MTLKEALIYALRNSDDYDGFYNRLPIKLEQVLNLLKQIPQWYHWHPEIDVATHTYYVCKALYQQGDFDLLEAGFFHDIGKLWTTNVGAKKIWHYGHAKESAKYVSENYRRFYSDLEQENYEFNKEIILHHMDNFSKDSNYTLSLDAMKAFQHADKILSKKLYLSETPFYKRWNNYIRQKWEFFKKRHSAFTVYVMVGISGSGKSTIAKKMFPEEQIVSSDAIRKELSGSVDNQKINTRVFEIAHFKLMSKCLLYKNAVLDATNVGKGLRIEFFGKGNAFNHCKKIALVVPCDADTGFGRVKKDIENKKDRSNVPNKAIQRQLNHFNKGLPSLWDEFEEVKFWNEEKQKFISMSLAEKRGLIK